MATETICARYRKYGDRRGGDWAATSQRACTTRYTGCSPRRRNVCRGRRALPPASQTCIQASATRGCAILFTHPEYDSPWAWTSDWGPVYQADPPIIFACLIPRLKEKSRELRAFSPANLAILKMLIESGARLEPVEGRDQWTTYILMEACWDYDSPEALSC